MPPALPGIDARVARKADERLALAGCRGIAARIGAQHLPGWVADDGVETAIGSRPPLLVQKHFRELQRPVEASDRASPRPKPFTRGVDRTRYDRRLAEAAVEQRVIEVSVRSAAHPPEAPQVARRFPAGAARVFVDARRAPPCHGRLRRSRLARSRCPAGARVSTRAHPTTRTASRAARAWAVGPAGGRRARLGARPPRGCCRPQGDGLETTTADLRPASPARAKAAPIGPPSGCGPPRTGTGSRLGDASPRARCPTGRLPWRRRVLSGRAPTRQPESDRPRPGTRRCPSPGPIPAATESVRATVHPPAGPACRARAHRQSRAACRSAVVLRAALADGRKWMAGAVGLSRE